MPKEIRVARNRKSPGGLIQCSNPDCDGNISRRKYNNYLRFNKTPKCGKCGSDDLTVTAPYEMRNGRLIWLNKKLVRKSVQGKNRVGSKR